MHASHPLNTRKNVKTTRTHALGDLECLTLFYLRRCWGLQVCTTALPRKTPSYRPEGRYKEVTRSVSPSFSSATVRDMRRATDSHHGLQGRHEERHHHPALRRLLILRRQRGHRYLGHDFCRGKHKGGEWRRPTWPMLYACGPHRLQCHSCPNSFKIRA